jgi:hypothetical protein
VSSELARLCLSSLADSPPPPPPPPRSPVGVANPLPRRPSEGIPILTDCPQCFGFDDPAGSPASDPATRGEQNPPSLLQIGRPVVLRRMPRPEPIDAPKRAPLSAADLALIRAYNTRRVEGLYEVSERARERERERGARTHARKTLTRATRSRDSPRKSWRRAPSSPRLRLARRARCCCSSGPRRT